MATAVIQKASRVLAVVSAAATLLVMLLTVVDVLVRLVVGGSVPGLLEYSEVAMVFLVMCGIAYGQQQRVHVSVDLVTSRLRPPAAGRVVGGGLVIAALALCWLAYASGVSAVESIRSGEVRYGITEVPLWPARVMVPIGAGLVAAELVIQAASAFRGRTADGDLEGAAEEPWTPDGTAVER